MKPITPAEIRRILETTDSLGLHRESIVVPLAKEGAGLVRLISRGRIEITAPADVSVEEWLEDLPGQIGRLDLAGVRRVDSGET